MSRYRKIDTRMHGDKKFRALSGPQPNGKSLWYYLLTCPETTNIPGLFAAGDVRANSTKQVASAAGEGATAALLIREYLNEN